MTDVPAPPQSPSCAGVSSSWPPSLAGVVCCCRNGCDHLSTAPSWTPKNEIGQSLRNETGCYSVIICRSASSSLTSCMCVPTEKEAGRIPPHPDRSPHLDRRGRQNNTASVRTRKKPVNILMGHLLSSRVCQT